MGIHIVICKVCKADSLQGTPVPDTIIEIYDDMKSVLGDIAIQTMKEGGSSAPAPAARQSSPLGVSMQTIEEFYDTQAKLIVDALAGSLPQGTLERVLVGLLQRQLTLYRGTAVSR